MQIFPSFLIAEVPRKPSLTFQLPFQCVFLPIFPDFLPSCAGSDVSVLLCRARAIRFRQDSNEAVGGFFSQIGQLYMVHHLWGKFLLSAFFLVLGSFFFSPTKSAQSLCPGGNSFTKGKGNGVLKVGV